MMATRLTSFPIQALIDPKFDRPPPWLWSIHLRDFTWCIIRHVNGSDTFEWLAWRYEVWRCGSQLDFSLCEQGGQNES